MNQKQFQKSLNEFNKAESLLGENAFEPVNDWWYEKIEIEIERMWLFYWQAKGDEMGKSSEQIGAHIEKYGIPVQRARYFIQLTLLNFRRYKYRISDDILKISRDALKASMESENANTIYLATFVMGFTLLWYGSLEEAEIYLKKALKLAEKKGDKAYHSRCLTYLAVAYRRLNQPEKVSELMPACFSISEEANLTEYVGTAYGNMAWLELKKGNLKKAHSYGLQAIKVYEDFEGQYAIKTVEWINLLPLISVCIQQDNFNKTMDYIRKLVEPKLILLDGDIMVFAEKAIVEWDSGNYETAKELAKKVNTLAIENHYI